MYRNTTIIFQRKLVISILPHTSELWIQIKAQ